MVRVGVLDVAPLRDPGKACCARMMDLVVVAAGVAITADVIARRPKERDFYIPFLLSGAIRT